MNDGKLFMSQVGDPTNWDYSPEIKPEVVRLRLHENGTVDVCDLDVLDAWRARTGVEVTIMAKRVEVKPDAVVDAPD